MKYKRILLKLSGEALMGDQKYGIDSKMLTDYAIQIKEIHEMGVEIAIVIGGGNIFRGLSGINKGFDRVKGDSMGMLATIINSIALQSALENENYSKQKAVDLLQQKEIVIIAGGTGNPFFTTDTASSLRSVEIEAEVFLKGTRVDGVYTADPEKDPKAVKFEEITFDEVYKRGLNVMDLTAFTMCKENNMPVLVFDMNKNGNLKKIILGEKVGTLVKN